MLVCSSCHMKRPTAARLRSARAGKQATLASQRHHRPHTQLGTPAAHACWPPAHTHTCPPSSLAAEMARKTRRAGGGASISDAGAGEEQQQQQPQDTPAPEPVQQQQAEEAVEDLSPDRLRDELRAARAEIARLKAELAAAGQGDDVPRKAAAAAGALKPPHEVAELQERLQQLRKEQQAADAARDKAWKQLKAVVEEISSLAQPEYLQSLQVKAHD